MRLFATDQLLLLHLLVDDSGGGETHPLFHFLELQMNANTKIINAIRQSFDEQKKVNIDLRESSTLTGSGYGAGGRSQFDDAFAALRLANPFRRGARIVAAQNTSATQFVAKVGNATNQTNPWGYLFTPNTGTPNTATSVWQLPTRVVTAQLPVRTAALDDINAIQETLVNDLNLEFAQQEALSMARNNDQSGTTTTSTGGVDGLRGLDSYGSVAISAAATYGTSGAAITNGIHSIRNYQAVDFGDTSALVKIKAALPAQYWDDPSTAWHITPTAYWTLIANYDFADIGNSSGEFGALKSLYGIPVIVNPYLSDSYPVYLACWNRFVTIADAQEMSVQLFEQTAPGYLTLWAQKRMVSTITDPNAGVRLQITG